MTKPNDPQAADIGFFAALIDGDGRAVDHLLSDDFILVDMMSGSIIDKPSLISIIDAGQLKFESIEPADILVRCYDATAVITGRTDMRGSFSATPFSASSRYTHVYVMQQGRWRLVSAQGTPIAHGHVI